jgi:hypothetical protein
MSEKHRETARGREPDPSRLNESTPSAEKLPDGQYADHWVLSKEERSKGWVRPLRLTYRHVGIRPKYELRDLTDKEKEQYKDEGYVKYEPYPPGSHGLGRFWTEAQLTSGCGRTTTMPLACAETYAKQPGYYGSTFCCTCGTYPRVGADGEFVWEGTDERVGT